jgi:hypothetical protein
MEFYTKTIDLIPTTREMLNDRGCYGNGFASVLVPFKRLLFCPKCGSAYALDAVYENPAFKFHWALPEFHATCPTCKVGSGFRGAFKVVDKPDDEEKKIMLKRWNPLEIEILQDPYSTQTDYLWRIPEDYKRLIRDGKLFHLERCSGPVLDAIAKNQLFRFNNGTIYHMKEPTLGGILNRGWGIPRTIINWRQIFFVQVLRRQIESIALDYVTPFRLLTPEARHGSGAGGGIAIDPLMMFNAGWQVLPFPVNYQMLGAEANQVFPRELLDQGVETMLNDSGTPAELYKGTLQLQAAPVALRLYESTNADIPHDINNFWRWLTGEVGKILQWEEVDIKVKRVTIADDVEKQMAALQLFMSQQLSGQTALGMMGFNWAQEQQRLAEEARKQQEIQARTQEESDQQGFAQQVAKGQMQGGQGQPGGGGAGGAQGAPAQGGGGAQGAPAGGDPSQAGGMGPGPVTQYIQSMSPNTPITPQDMIATADGIAQGLLGQPESVKNSELRKLKQANQGLHMMVTSRITQIRRDTKSRAGNQAMGQWQQSGQPPA